MSERDCPHGYSAPLSDCAECKLAAAQERITVLERDLAADAPLLEAKQRDCERFIAARAAARTEAQRLREALLKYGRHADGPSQFRCARIAHGYDKRAACTCGLDEALRDPAGGE